MAAIAKLAVLASSSLLCELLDCTAPPLACVAACYAQRSVGALVNVHAVSLLGTVIDRANILCTGMPHVRAHNMAHHAELTQQ